MRSSTGSTIICSSGRISATSTCRNNLAGVRSEGLLPDFRTALRSFNYVNSAAQNIALDNQVQADFATGPLLHKVLVGFDYQRQASTSDYKFAMIAPIDVFAPVYGAFVPPASTLAVLHQYGDHDEPGRSLRSRIRSSSIAGP